MKTFRISTNDDMEFNVRANSYDDAARIACNRINGRNRQAIRSTGHPMLSGMFSCYKWCKKHNCFASIGVDFHVNKID